MLAHVDYSKRVKSYCFINVNIHVQYNWEQIFAFFNILATMNKKLKCF